jgi:hypothetical protein
MIVASIGNTALFEKDEVPVRGGGQEDLFFSF